MSLRLLLEGESLLNDASSITLFTIFLSEVQDYRDHKPASGGVVLGNIVSKMLWLAIGRAVEAHPLLLLSCHGLYQDLCIAEKAPAASI